jgi:hypothetical protein
MITGADAAKIENDTASTDKTVSRNERFFFMMGLLL